LLDDPVVTPLPISIGSIAGVPVAAENGCGIPGDIKAKQTTPTYALGAYGTRLFVSCQSSDTIMAIDYNTGSGSHSLDSLTLLGAVSTDGVRIANNTGFYVDACGQGGSSSARDRPGHSFHDRRIQSNSSVRTARGLMERTITNTLWWREALCRVPGST